MSEIYFVSGTVIYYELCGCEFCEGHDRKTMVGENMLADSPEEAIKLVLESVELRYNESMDQDAEWDKKNPPKAMINNEELFMKITKAPMLLLETPAKETK